ncbi:10332_t:CDS:2, partial [Gigaspora rosea]
EWDYLFDTSQNINNFDSEQNSGDKRNSDSMNKDTQNPENPSTNFNKQATLNEEIADDVEEIKQ